VLRHVTPLEWLDQSPLFGDRKGKVERRLAVGAEVFLDQNDDLDGGKVGIGQVFQDVSIIHRGAVVRDFDIAPAFERHK
jgi:hypothetical protein